MLKKNQQRMGALLGLVWGDVLGTPIESWSNENIKSVYNRYKILPNKYDINKMEQIPEKLMKLRPLGIYSDDTQQSLLLLNICKNNNWNIDKWNSALVNGHKLESWRGTGSSFKQTIDNLNNNIEYHQAGSDSAGIGSAMRIGSVGALYYNDINKLKKVVIESTLTTHRNIAAVSIAYAIAYSIAQIIQNKSISNIKKELPNILIDFENEVIKYYSDWNINTDFHLMLPKLLKEVLALNPFYFSFSKKLLSYSKTILNDNKKRSINDPFVFLGGVHGLAKGLAYHNNPHQILETIMNIGDDTDTVGAIAGSILGARFGYKWIPFFEIMQHERIWNYARSIVKNQEIESLDTFLLNESYLTTKENHFINVILEKHKALFPQKYGSL